MLNLTPVILAPPVITYKIPPPDIEIRDGTYLLRFARAAHELDAILQLRFEVFNLELHEGLETSYQTGRDWDKFDATCHHLMVLDTTTNAVVGTYRLQTHDMALAGHGFYSAEEFDLTRLPLSLKREAIELGRACIARDHRNLTVLFLLWKGVATYMRHQQKRYFFGCCSLTSQDEREGWQLLQWLEQQGHLHPQINIPPTPSFTCHHVINSSPITVKIPRLFKAYLRYGAKCCSPPAIDRQFKTIDFFILFDFETLSPATRQFFSGELAS